jgi:uncharacterized protein (DUF2336 family)
MTTALNLIDELEASFETSSIGRRAEMLQQVTNLFVADAGQYSEAQVALFDDVMSRLCAEIETVARAALARRLARVPQAPQGLIQILAADDSIEVAGSVLAQSPRLDDAFLVETARTMSQGHLLAISERASIAEPVTTVLIERGNREVALSTVGNPGARFSEEGYDKLILRSTTDDRIAQGVVLRRDVPRRHLLRLFAEASEFVRIKLEALDHSRADIIRNVVSEASRNVQASLHERSHDYQAARMAIATLQAAGALDEAKLREFAIAKRLNEATIALSVLCGLPPDLIERGMVQDRGNLLLVLGKSIGLEWPTLKELLQLRAGGCSPQHLEDAWGTFAKISPDTARKALRFFRLRAKAG